jgi:hypothetical protein
MMRKRASVPREPTLDMCIAFMRARGWTPKFTAQWTNYLRRTLGTPGECAFVAGLRAAIAVGAGLPLEQVKRGHRSKAST